MSDTTLKKVQITWQKSTIGHTQRTRRTVQALGLRRRGDTIVKELTPAVAGMINAVEFLLKVEDVS